MWITWAVICWLWLGATLAKEVLLLLLLRMMLLHHLRHHLRHISTTLVLTKQ
jgi:hypothetical protein